MNIVLFTSTTSKVCADLEQFLNHYKINVQRVFLDTQHDRERAANGSNFKITYVPTLAVFSNDVRLFVGADKISAWFMEMMKQNQPQNQTQPQTPYPQTQYSQSQNIPQETLVEEEEEEEVLSSQPKKRKVTKKKKKKGSERDNVEYLDIGGDSEAIPQPRRSIKSQPNLLSMAESPKNQKGNATKMTAEQMMREREATNRQFGWKDEFGR